MKVINKTCWRTDDLKAILQRVARQFAEPAKRKKFIVTVVHTRGRFGFSGCARVNGCTSRLRLPKAHDSRGERFFLLSLVVLAAHEFAHNRGLTGERWMRKSVAYGQPWRHKNDPDTLAKQEAMYSWVFDMPLRLQEAKPAKTKPGDDAKVARLQARLKAWQTKKKRAETAIKAIQKSLKYYAKKAEK